MKFLTLNTHSWMEKDPEEKFQLLLQDILENNYDVICFQEINQEITSEQVEAGPLYQPLPSARANSSRPLCSSLGREVG